MTIFLSCYKFLLYFRGKEWTTGFKETFSFAATLRPEVQISEEKDKSGKKLKLDCRVTLGGDPVDTGITWTDESGKKLSDGSKLEVTLKNGTNTMRCNFKFSIWQGSKTLIRTFVEEAPDTGKYPFVYF